MEKTRLPESYDPEKILSAVEKIDNALQITSEVSEVLDRVIQEVLDIFQSDRAWLFYPCNAGVPSFHVTFESTTPAFPGAKALNETVPMTDDMAGYCRQALSRGGEPRVDPEPGCFMQNDIALRFGVKSLMFMALRPKVGDAWMFGLHQCDHERIWTDAEKQLFRIIGRRITDTIGNMRYMEQLRDSEEKYRRLVNAAPYGIQLTDTEGRIVFSNPAHHRIQGYDTPELIGKFIWDLIAEKDAKKKTKEFYRQIIHDQPEPRVYHNVDKTKDGRLIKAEIHWDYIRNRQGDVTGIISIISDETEKKRAEAALVKSESKFRNLVQAASDAIFLLSGDGKVLDVNPAVCSALDRSRKELLDMDVHGIDPNFTVDEFIGFWRDVPYDQPMTFETTHWRSDGSLVPVEVCGQKFKMEGDTFYYGIARDITARKAAEKEKGELEAKLRQAQKMEAVGRLAGGVAHDFNNMLSVIIGHADMGLEELDTHDPLHAGLKEIKKAGERSADLTRQLLAFARKQTISPKVLDLNPTVGQMLKMLQRLIGEDLELIWQPAESPCTVRIDPGQIDQILANLCVNARDAISGVGRITIGTGCVGVDEAFCRDHPGSSPGDYVRLTVADDGCGMDAETLDNIFEPFFTTKETGRGTGLGLATVYGIVKQNKGFIHVDSRPGQGTTFHIYLPRHQSIPKPRDENTRNKPSAVGQETILLVEHEAQILRMTTLMLESLGYRVLQAETPVQALRLAEAHAGCIDLIMTDVIMPEMNGRELARKILSAHPGQKCLFMSGYTADVIAHHGVLNEGVHFIQKPFSRNRLIEVVGKILKDNGS